LRLRILFFDKCALLVHHRADTEARVAANFFWSHLHEIAAFETLLLRCELTSRRIHLHQLIFRSFSYSKIFNGYGCEFEGRRAFGELAKKCFQMLFWIVF